jgi:hypothetical protein
MSLKRTVKTSRCQYLLLEGNINVLARLNSGLDKREEPREGGLRLIDEVSFARPAYEDAPFRILRGVAGMYADALEAGDVEQERKILAEVGAMVDDYAVAPARDGGLPWDLPRRYRLARDFPDFVFEREAIKAAAL